MRRPRAALATAAGGVILLGGTGYLVANDLIDDLRLAPIGRHCVVRASGEVTLDADQMANAATIAAIGARQGLPERAVIVALATALQESKLRNLSGGDRDSVGLFQQRPSMGWGKATQISNPRYASTRFYRALAKVDGWEKLKVTDAAQRVQRSAYPKAYQQWADEAAVLTRALMGHATGAVACTLPAPTGPFVADAANVVLRGLTLDWGQLDSTPLDSSELAVKVNSVSSGWRYAHWLVAHASQHSVTAVTFGGMAWTAKGGRWVTAQGSDGNTVLAKVFPGK